MLDVILVGLGLLILFGAIAWITRDHRRSQMTLPTKSGHSVGRPYSRGYARPPNDPPRRYPISPIPETKTPPKPRWRNIQLLSVLLLAMMTIAIWIVVGWLYH